MGDMAEVWEGYAKKSSAKRASNRANSTQILCDFDIHFTSHNEGCHLIIKCHDATIYFWPGTDKWLVRGRLIAKHGVMGLVNFCQNKLKASQVNDAINKERNT